MLGDRQAGCGRDESDRRRDIEGARTVAAGAARVYEGAFPPFDRGGLLAHHLGESGYLVHRFALAAQGDQKPSNLCIGGVATQDLIHHGPRGIAIKILVGQ